MTGKRRVVLVHGIGKGAATDRWIKPLNASLAAAGWPSVDANVEDIINVDYTRALNAGSETTPPERTWKKKSEEQHAEAWHRYLIRKATLGELIEAHRNEKPDLPLGDLPSGLADPLSHLLPPVHRYVASSKLRNAVWSSVLQQLPQDGNAIVIAHSLGSIVMLDMLTRLPPGLHIDLLLTIGSPAAIGELRGNHGGVDKPSGFPADKVDAWVNVYDPDDLVTIGRGAARHFPAAIDIPIDTGNAHWLGAYMSHPVVGAAFGTIYFGPLRPASEGTPALKLHDQWWPLVLRFAFTHQLWNAWPKDEWKKRGRMDTARTVLAERTVREIDAQRSLVERQVASLPEPLRSQMQAQLVDRPFAFGCAPTVSTLYRHAGEVSRNHFSDEELILSGVDLLLSQPFAPFGIEVQNERSEEALGYLLERIRKDTSDLSGKEFAAALAKSVDETREALSSRGIPWAPLLLGAGVLLLAATGVGLAVAAPAGLAGAAAITATLATFGPGGMVGGVATLAVLSGTSAALSAAGLALGGAEGAEFARIQAALAEEISRMPVAAFRTAIAGLLAVQRARQLVGHEVFADLLERTLLAIEASVLSEESLHREIAPKADATREWEAKAEIMAKALSWMSVQFKDDGVRTSDRVAVAKTIESGESLPALVGSSTSRQLEAAPS